MSSIPHLAPVPPVSIRRGALWILGEGNDSDAAPMFVEWEAPVGEASRPVVVFVHGGGGQSLDWRLTVDGRAGWADRFIGHGHPVYLVDRPGHGRSRGALAPRAVAAPATAAQIAFAFGGSAAGDHTQWPWPGDAGSVQVRRLAAASAPLAADLAAAETREAERLAALLEQTGPAVLVTHSLGACAAWRAAAEHPDLVRAIIALEPAGPPFAVIPGVGRLDGGLTASQLSPRADGEVPLRGIPVRVVVGEVSPFRAGVEATADHLRALGADVVVEHLEDHGITGNGHGFMMEANSDETADLVSALTVATARGLDRPTL